MRCKHLLFTSLFLAGLGVISPLATADVIYNLTIDTSGQLANQGWIEFQFNSSSFGAQLADADVMNFATDGALIPTGQNTNDSSGQLPGTVSMDNGTTFDDYFEELTFGTTITLTLDLSGPALTSPNGQGGGTFTLDFLSADQSAFLFTDDPTNDVPVFTVDINPDGSVTPATYQSAGGGSPVVTFTTGSQQTVPEPATVVLTWFVLLAFAGLRRMKKRSMLR
jgi:hypothetical protein